MCYILVCEQHWCCLYTEFFNNLIYLQKIIRFTRIYVKGLLPIDSLTYNLNIALNIYSQQVNQFYQQLL